MALAEIVGEPADDEAGDDAANGAQAEGEGGGRTRAGAVLQERDLVDKEARLRQQHKHEGHGYCPERERSHGLG